MDVYFRKTVMSARLSSASLDLIACVARGEVLAKLARVIVCNVKDREWCMSPDCNSCPGIKMTTNVKPTLHFGRGFLPGDSCHLGLIYAPQPQALGRILLWLTKNGDYGILSTDWCALVYNAKCERVMRVGSEGRYK